MDEHLLQHKKFLYQALLVNAVLLTVKLIGAFLSNSLSLLADSMDTALDLASAITSYFGARHALKGPDHEHHYGHYRIESLGSMFLAFIMGITVYTLLRDAIDRLFFGARVEFGWFAALAALLSIILKFLLSLSVAAIAKETKSSILKDYSRQIRLDSWTSLVSLIGVVSPVLHLGVLDAIGAILISTVLAVTALQISREQLAALVDKAPPSHIVDQVREVIQTTEGVKNYEKLRLRRVGSKIMGDVHVRVDPEISVKEGHDISMLVKRRVIELTDVEDFLVHIEPYYPSSPSSSPSAE